MSKLKIGDTVMINNGPFENETGVIERIADNDTDSRYLINIGNAKVKVLESDIEAYEAPTEKKGEATGKRLYTISDINKAILKICDCNYIRSTFEDVSPDNMSSKFVIQTSSAWFLGCTMLLEELQKND